MGCGASSQAAQPAPPADKPAEKKKDDEKLKSKPKTPEPAPEPAAPAPEPETDKDAGNDADSADKGGADDSKDADANAEPAAPDAADKPAEEGATETPAAKEDDEEEKKEAAEEEKPATDGEQPAAGEETQQAEQDTPAADTAGAGGDDDDDDEVDEEDLEDLLESKKREVHIKCIVEGGDPIVAQIPRETTFSDLKSRLRGAAGGAVTLLTKDGEGNLVALEADEQLEAAFKAYEGNRKKFLRLVARKVEAVAADGAGDDVIDPDDIDDILEGKKTHVNIECTLGESTIACVVPRETTFVDLKHRLKTAFGQSLNLFVDGQQIQDEDALKAIFEEHSKNTKQFLLVEAKPFEVAADDDMDADELEDLLDDKKDFVNISCAVDGIEDAATIECRVPRDVDFADLRNRLRTTLGKPIRIKQGEREISSAAALREVFDAFATTRDRELALVAVVVSDDEDDEDDELADLLEQKETEIAFRCVVDGKDEAIEAVVPRDASFSDIHSRLRGVFGRPFKLLTTIDGEKVQLDSEESLARAVKPYLTSKDRFIEISLVAIDDAANDAEKNDDDEDDLDEDDLADLQEEKKSQIHLACSMPGKDDISFVVPRPLALDDLKTRLEGVFAAKDVSFTVKGADEAITSQDMLDAAITAHEARIRAKFLRLVLSAPSEDA